MNTESTPPPEGLAAATGPEPLRYWVEGALMDRIKASLEDGLENTHSALIEHDSSLGRTTHKNRWWAETLERQIEEMKAVIQMLPNDIRQPPLPSDDTNNTKAQPGSGWLHEMVGPWPTERKT